MPPGNMNGLRGSCIVKLLTFATGAFGMSFNSTTGAVTYAVGIFGPMTSVSQQYLAAAVAFDIDFRKHYDPALVAEFGSPVVDIPNLNANLRIQTIIGTSDSDPDVGLKTVGDWVAGDAPFPTVDAVVGGEDSSITSKVARLCQAFEVPQVSWGATEPQLSDKAHFPFLARTVPSDHLQGAALWAWIVHFGIPSALVMYPEDPYGLGLFQSLEAAASAAGERFRIDGVALHDMSSQLEFSTTEAEQALTDALTMVTSRFILLCMYSPLATFVMNMMEKAGMLYSGSYQIMGAEGVQLEPGQSLAPSRGVPVGFQKLYPKARGTRFSRLTALWNSMTVDHVYGTSAKARYFLDDMRVTVENASAPVLLPTDFLADMEPEVGFLFDAAYTVAIAINDLLNQGAPPEAVRGARLVEQIKHVAFEGVTGNISFDAHLDRQAGYELWNARQEDIIDVLELGTRVGDIDSGSLVLLMDPVWATGNSSALPPSSLADCPSGFEQDVSLGRCAPCIPGIGCGYNPEVGFPLGVIVSVNMPEIMASAVLFDLDFRKHFEPALVERFGPPLVDIPNLHPDLKAKVIIGDANRDIATGVETTLQWMTGKVESDIPKVAGIVGDFFSHITGPIATNCDVFQVPQVSYASSSPDFSDKGVYPWLMRTMPPVSFEALALWEFLNYFGIPMLVLAYTREEFSSGHFNSLAGFAIAAGQSNRLVGVAMPFDHSFTVEQFIPYVEQCQAVNTRFLGMTVNGAIPKARFLKALEVQGVLYGPNAYQLFGPGGQQNPELSEGPSMGLPVGMFDFDPLAAGASFPHYLEMHSNLTNDDIWSLAAMERYQLDKLLVAHDPLPVFDPNEPPHLAGSMLVDALYTYIVAINNLLNAGIPPESIHGQVLLAELATTSFAGPSGFVSFNENYDRLGDYSVKNVQQNGPGYEFAGIWTSATNTFDFTTDLYWAGGFVGFSVPEELVACAPGQRWDDGVGLCTSCPLNWYSDGGVGAAATCAACEPGSVSNRPIGATGCTTCEAGYFRTISDDNCTACPLGHFGAGPGQSACVACPVGEYASSQGHSQCDVCGAGRSSAHLFTTMIEIPVDGDIEYTQIIAATSAEDCGCNRGARRDGSGNCVPCTEGMICRGMNDVRIEEGYYAEAVVGGELSIFKCYGESNRCVGGLPGETCASGREGIACSECLEDQTPASGGTCKKCGGGDLGPFVATVILGVLALIFTYNIIDTQNRATQSHSLLLCGIATGQFITMSQQIGVVGMLAVDWENPLKSVLHFMGILTFNIEVLRLNCVTAGGPVERFVLKVCLIFITIMLVVLIHCIAVLVRYKGDFAKHHHALIGAVGTMFMVFNIAVTSTVLEPLQCQEHPNEKWTIRNYPSITCWDSSEHATMLTIGTVAFFLVPMNYLVACVAVVRQFPARMRAADEQFLKAFYFLFFRFQPQHYAYVLITILRSFFVAAVLVFPDVTTQVFLLQLILLLAYSTTVYWCPWRVKLANVLDAVFGGGMVLLVCLASLFIPSDSKSFTGIAWLTTVFLVGLLILAPCTIAYGLCKKYLRGKKPFQYFLCHHKNGSGAYTRLLKMHLQTSPKVQRKVFVDSDNLENLDRLFDFVGNDTSTLLVIRSEAIYTRPYCIGEMCTARLKNVVVVTLGLPNSLPPEDEFIESLGNRVSDLHVLTENGISIEMLAETMVWIRSQPCIHVPDVVAGSVMAALVEKISTKDYTDVPANLSRRSGSQVNRARAASVSLYDFSSMEAASTAQILKMCLAPLLLHESDKIPQPMESTEFEDFPQAMVVICMNGTFEQFGVLRVLAAMTKFQCTTVPIIAEHGFRFPSKDTQELVRRCEAAGLEAEKGEAIAVVLATIFKEIGVDFNAQHSGETLLNLGAQTISHRLMSIQSPRPGSAKNMKPGSGFAGFLPGKQDSTCEKVDTTRTYEKVDTTRTSQRSSRPLQDVDQWIKPEGSLISRI